MRLLQLPNYREDWQWVASLNNLDEIEVSLLDLKRRSHDSGSRDHSERLHVHGEVIECTRLSADGTFGILSNLPQTMRSKVMIPAFVYVLDEANDRIK